MIGESIAALIAYAEAHLGLDKADEVYLSNLLLGLFKAEAPYDGPLDRKSIAELKVPDVLLAPLQGYLVEERKLTPSEAERVLVHAMGLLTPLPSKTIADFESLRAVSPEKATEYLYDLSIKNNYIQKSKVDKNLHWDARYADGPALEISVNLSKPEKNNKDIAKLVTAKPAGYPKCLLCKENEGYEGTETLPARGNIRVIPLDLGGEKWFLQYSPYVYYSHHLICFYEKHVPMKINARIIDRLFDFVDLFPHFFIGSNSDLPIVGGSILNHEHFQGGGHEMPVMKALDREPIAQKRFPGCRISILDFYDTVLKIVGSDRAEVSAFGAAICESWRHYDDPAHAIVSEEGGVQHSTITPILRKRDGVYELFIILRNNRCDERYPDGIFHAHPEYHMIKKEGIGLIEAAGLFILPARLKRQGALIEGILAEKMTQEAALAANPDLTDFIPFIAHLQKESLSVEEGINEVCRAILMNVAVYKNDKKGQEGLRAFLRQMDL